MPSSSLWLVPPTDSPLFKHLETLIATHIPAIYHSSSSTTTSSSPSKLPPKFYPHITLTSDFPLAFPEPLCAATYPLAQTWLDSRPDPASTIDSAELEVHLLAPQSESPFFRKLTIEARKDDALVALASACRTAVLRDAAGAKAGKGEEGGESEESVEAQVERWAEGEYAPHLSLMYSDLSVADVTVKLNNVRDAIAKARQGMSVEGEVTKGGSIWLVETFRPISEWRPVAVRSLPEMTWRFG